MTLSGDFDASLNGGLTQIPGGFMIAQDFMSLRVFLLTNATV
ncbi:hypothetical protein SBA2_20027 [Acidobacteriia bacterium SbA2]|nr:hypothetical protein SBA2_20027 [Acidobacteriia bacterium SbA2]